VCLYNRVLVVQIVRVVISTCYPSTPAGLTMVHCVIGFSCRCAIPRKGLEDSPYLAKCVACDAMIPGPMCHKVPGSSSWVFQRHSRCIQSMDPSSAKPSFVTGTWNACTGSQIKR